MVERRKRTRRPARKPATPTAAALRRLERDNARLREQAAELQLRLDEAGETLDAIRAGDVECLVVDGAAGPKIYALEGVNRSYRILIEAMSEGAASLSDEGTVLYCNRRFAAMLETPLEQVMGRSLYDFVFDNQRLILQALLRRTLEGQSRGEVVLQTGEHKAVPAYLSVSVAEDDGRHVLSLVATDLRERKRHDEIVASEEFARSVIDQAADAIVVCDEIGRIIRASTAAASLCGGTPLLRSFDEAFSLELAEPKPEPEPERTPTPEPRSRRDSVVQRALRGESVRVAAAVMRRPDGVSVDLLVSAAALHGAQGRVVGCVVSLVDVSQAKQAEKALRDSEARFRSVLENSLDAAYRRDLRSDTFDFLSPRIEAVHGFSAAEFCAMSQKEAVARVHPDDRPLLEAALRKADETGELRVEYRFKGKDGRYRWLAEQAAVVRDESGRPRFRAGSVRDVTERKQAEDALRHSEDRYRTLFEASPAGIVVLDPDGRILEFNERAHCELGYSREEFARLKLEDISSNDRSAIRRWVERILQEGGALFEAQHRTRTGDIRDVVVDVRVLELGGSVRLLNVWRDITERKRTEEALREADRNKNHFLAMLSHELRNPLAPIRNSLYILDRAVPGGEQAARAKAVIDRQVGHLTRLVEDLLDVTRISRGRDPAATRRRRPGRDRAPNRGGFPPGLRRRRHRARELRRRGEAADSRRPDAPGPDRRQPPEQRHQVHVARRAHDGVIGEGRSQQRGGARGERQRRWPLGGDARPPVRAFLAGRRHPRSQPWRPGPRAVARQGAGRAARRQRQRHQRGHRQRRLIRGAAAVGGRDRARAYR